MTKGSDARTLSSQQHGTGRTDVATPPTGQMPSGREVIARVVTPTGEWQLQRHGLHLEIICNGVFLMASYNRSSGGELASLALGHMEGERIRVLIGGLGIGYSVQAALANPQVSYVDVVEVEPVMVAWHHAYFADRCGRPLEDPRTRLIEADVHELSLPPQSYDAILLDTDNGPDWLARDVNHRLYTAQAVARYLQALTPRGILAVWSAEPSSQFVRTLATLGAVMTAAEVPDEIAPGRASTAWIYLARRGDNPV